MENETINNLASDFMITLMPFMDSTIVLTYIATKLISSKKIWGVIKSLDWHVVENMEDQIKSTLNLKETLKINDEENKVKLLLSSILTTIIYNKIYFIYSLTDAKYINDPPKEKYQEEIPINILIDSLMVDFEKKIKESSLYLYIMICIFDLCKKNKINLVQHYVYDKNIYPFILN